VNAVIAQMSQVTQQIAANAEESASGAEELSGQAEEMKSMVSAFRLSDIDIHGGSVPSAQKMSRLERMASLQ
jgi:methyl-accepting chemotaxis protein